HPLCALLVVASWVAPAPISNSAENEPSATSARTLNFEDQEAVKSPGSPAISRDGKLLAYVLDEQIFVVPLAGGTPRAVTSAGSSAWDPRWSKDGSALYFLSDRSGSSQLWKLPLATFGEAEQLTKLEQGVGEIHFSPDESQLLLGFTDSALESPAEAAQGKDPKPFVITRLEFKEDAGEGYLTGDRADHLHALDVATGKLTQLTSGEHSEADAAWSPDGSRIVFASNREADPDATYRSDLWIVDAGNTDKGAALVRLTDDERTKSEPAFSPDGRSIAFLVAEDGVYGAPQVAVMPASGGEARVLTAPLDRWVNGFRYSADGQWIYFNYENLGGNQLARVRPKDGRLETVVEGNKSIGGFDVAPDGGIAAEVASGHAGPEIAAFAGGRERRLTAVNAGFHARVALGSKETVSFRSSDGTEVQAFVTKPPGFVAGRRYPTILHVHGGPVGQFGWGFDFKPQYFAANGYVVIEPNPRGSTGRGQDFVRAIYQTWGITDYDDLIAAVDYAIAQGYADPERLAVTGYSYGGYMTNTVITRTDRFKAAASGAGHSYIAANYGHDIYQKWYNWELGSPWENREKYDRLSPLLQAGRVTTPTIFLGGREDWNVPLINAELFYQSLRKRGVPTELVIYPGAHHGGWPAGFERDYLERVLAWFDRYLK
ncbi:MAG TPA: S9 family peptidase, partial [Steroidobacteraceae bacterium]|nr:S9 family peptidase [Steroidobacteraceae bacterium]